MTTLNVLIIGTGRMAGTHAERYSEIPGVKILAAVDVNKARVTAFCKEYGIAHAYTDLSEALSHHSFEAASVVTPDNWHAENSIACLNAGLAVLCEKPLSDSVNSSNEMVRVARHTELLNVVNLSYRVSGALHQARQWVNENKLGEIRHIEASYRQSWLCSPYWGDWRTEAGWLWRLSTQHGSLGVLGDIGIHILDFVLAGVGLEIDGLQCRIKTFDKAPGNKIGEYHLDANDSCVINLEMSNGALGVVHMSRYQTGYMNDLFLTIHGTKGALKSSTGQNGDVLQSCLGQDIHHQKWTCVACDNQPDTFARFIAALSAGRVNESPDFAHAARLQQYLDQCFLSHDEGRWISN